MAVNHVCNKFLSRGLKLIIKHASLRLLMLFYTLQLNNMTQGKKILVHHCLTYTLLTLHK